MPIKSDANVLDTNVWLHTHDQLPNSSSQRMKVSLNSIQQGAISH